ncbi:extracellular matrix regulator RemB [Caenibacillus caldisaponilyticus]|jgi:regulator of extracellular matrix RemA (YlzA/DUF370 family)|uniref:extracellular matrix regulator RemB n=1 Tax=Caenibacillus caldisaponilyticus TaxID=1674942 RepID=UPI00098835D5|nr:DUF370 domain-containing protein [Caenibacillus caldisaponilyticus]
MFIHLGEDTVIRIDEVVAIINYGLFLKDEGNKALIERAKMENKLRDIGRQMTKSVVITDKYIYFSPFSPTTLKKRSRHFY